MDLNTMVYAGLTVFAGGLLQGMVAFGFGLLTVPLLLMAGFPMPMVLAMSSVSTAAGSKGMLRRMAFIVLLIIAWNAMIPQAARWYYGL